MKLVVVFLLTIIFAVAQCAEVKVDLPLKRSAYQTNEWIDIAVTRAGAGAGNLVMTVIGQNGSKLTFNFAVTRQVELLKLNGWLLRPGNYIVTVSDGDAISKDTPIEIYSHERTTSFKLINWGRADGKDLVPLGENGFGFNIYYAHYGGNDQNNNIRGGVDYFPCCSMGGGHQMDLRMECDWSDPNVLGGGRARVSRSALKERVNSNCLGIHFYDEPGLTWWTDPITKKVTNASIPAQVRSFKDAFGYDVPHYSTFDRKNTSDFEKFKKFTFWKANLMDAAWQDAAFGVNYVKPDFMTATQSQYGWMAFSDGYYFPITRNLSVTSGHGGYHDWGPGYWHPSFTVEIARARDFSKPTWYLPGWYGNTTSDQFRLEQYLSFQTNIQGMISPPDLDPMKNTGARSGITESNKMMGRFGTVFNTMPVTRGPVAILYSISEMVNKCVQDPDKYYYAHTMPHGESIHIPYIATKLMQVNSQFVVDEDIVDGTLQSNYKAVIINAVDFLDPAVVANLERFIVNGGKVYITDDSTVKITGATKLPVKSGYLASGFTKAEIMKADIAKKTAELAAITDKVKLDAAKKEIDALKAQMGALTYGLRASLQAAQEWVKVLKPELSKAGINPVFNCSEPGISGTSQSQGDVEYLFAVNATHDYDSPNTQLALKTVKANINMPDDGRPIYDAIRSQTVTELKTDKKSKTIGGSFSFGPGQMRIFARTARPIGKLLVSKPVITTDTTLEKAPVKLNIRAMVLDNTGEVLVGSFPLQIRVIDPTGAIRYDLYRATKDGMFEISLPLAVNDPTGAWKVEITELLNNTIGMSGFTWQPMKIAGSVAGATPRAITFGNDRDNMKRFFRVHKIIYLITGTSDYSIAAAQRFANSVAPWGITCNIAKAADMNKPEPERVDQWLIDQYKDLLQQRKRTSTWCGPNGYDVPGPCVLFGNPDDNPLIKGIMGQKVLPYTPDKASFPGVGRSMLAWQLDSIRQGQESVTVIAYDAIGMDEGVGSLYQTVADQDPINKLDMPATAEVVPATTSVIVPKATIVWKVNLPERADDITVENGKATIITHDGTATIIDATGKITGQKTAGALPAKAVQITPADAVKKAMLTNLAVKTIIVDTNATAVSYWGGTVQIIDNNGTVKSCQLMQQDTSEMAWLNGTLIVGLADGQVFGLK
jgi:hypothetical protein